MNTVKNFVLCGICSLLSHLAIAQEPKMLQPEEPVVLKARKIQPYEIVSGTSMPLAILSSDELLPIAQITMNVYDSFGNIAIPQGSRLVGKYIDKKNGRHFIRWTGLQIPSVAGTLKLEPALMVSTRDGSLGIVEFAPGSLASTIIREPFLVPH